MPGWEYEWKQFDVRGFWLVRVPGWKINDLKSSQVSENIGGIFSKALLSVPRHARPFRLKIKTSGRLLETKKLTRLFLISEWNNKKHLLVNPAVCSSSRYLSNYFDNKRFLFTAKHRSAVCFYSDKTRREKSGVFSWKKFHRVFCYSDTDS